MKDCCSFEKPCKKHLQMGLEKFIEDFDVEQISFANKERAPRWMQDQFIWFSQEKFPESDFIKIFEHLARLQVILYKGKPIFPEAENAELD